jgi:iron complex outermembrane receptor protein
MSATYLKTSLLLGASLAPFYFSAASAQQSNTAETVIVTGTRVQGMTAADSAAPITVLGNDALVRGTGSTDLRQALGQMVPSFTAESTASDTARLNLNAALRGLSPNDTLVMVNGKRRHGTANLNVSSVNSFAGSAAPDISMIPSAAIDHVEVLLDGAAAQYGTDAIAGVVNFILKSNSSGGNVSAQIGRNYAEDEDGTHRGDRYDISFNMGLPLFDKGFINLTLDKKYNGAAHTGGPDGRLILPTGAVVAEGQIGFGATATHNTFAVNPATGVVPCTAGVCIPLAMRQALPDYPRINYIGAVTASDTTAMVNAGYDVSDDVHIYSFGSWGHRFAQAPQNERLPNQVIAAPGSDQPFNAVTNPQGYKNGLRTNGTPVTSGQAGTLYTPGELVPFPLGFTPIEAISEEDYQYNLGAKFKLAGWDLDIGGSYGKDRDNVFTNNSANLSLFTDTHTTPTNFYDGTFVASEFLGTIDATHQYNIGMASPLTVAMGLEAREDFYQIDAGDPASRYKEGPQAYPGFQLSDASAHSRKNYGAYIDFAVAPIEALQLDIAGRAEHYTDFGDAQIGKITARYDFSPQWGIRGTISTGFRAPTLEEEYYSATKVAPTSAVVQLPANSPASQLLGVPNLKPETSTQYSVGIVAHPFEDLSATLDAYSLTLGNRIVHSSEIFSLGGAINSPLVNQAIVLHGNVLDPTATQNGVYMFQNGFSTLTQGVDLTVNYPTDFGDYGLVDWTLAANYNQTSVSKVAPVPAVLVAGSPPGVSFFPNYVLYNFVHGSPPEKIGLSANWTLGDWGVTLRDTYYGSEHQIVAFLGAAPFYNFHQAGVGLFDAEIRYNLTEQFQIAVGGNNLFNIIPDAQPPLNNLPAASNGETQALAGGTGGVLGNPADAPYEPYGGLYYARVTLNF